MPKNVQKPPPGDRPLKTLERVLSKAGLGSRTEARSWIGGGRVSVKGRVARNPDAWIDMERDRVTFDGKPLRREERTYLLLHKPAGYITTYRDPHGRPTIYDLLPDRERYLFPVGRLDLDTSGLDRKSTRLNSSHLGISYAVFCLKKKKSITVVRPIH